MISQLKNLVISAGLIPPLLIGCATATKTTQETTQETCWIQTITYRAINRDELDNFRIESWAKLKCGDPNTIERRGPNEPLPKEPKIIDTKCYLNKQLAEFICHYIYEE